MAVSGFQMLFQSIWLGCLGIGSSAVSESGKATGRFSLEHAQVVLISIFLLSIHNMIEVA
ncbi:MAG: hypothetical protein MZV70_33235 [Desulfobacterales bacterium]|nr:hypothetical protein [Desulfobacterales bacterium]